MPDRVAFPPVFLSLRHPSFRSALFSLTVLTALLAAADNGSEAFAQQQPPPPVTDPPAQAAPAQATPAAAAQDAPPPPTAPADETMVVVTVRSATGELLPRAAVRLESDTERSRSQTSDASGVATFRRISDGTYTVTVTAIGYRTRKLTGLVVVPNKTVAFGVRVNRFIERVVIRREVELLDPHDTSISVTRNKMFIDAFPLNAGNRQSLSPILTSAAGVSVDSLNRVHGRGSDDISRSIYTDGFQNPQFAQGSQSAFYLPDTIRSLRIITGGFAPEFGNGDLVLDTSLRAAPTRVGVPNLEGAIQAGEFNTTNNLLQYGYRFIAPADRQAALAQSRANRLATTPTTAPATPDATATTPAAPAPPRPARTRFIRNVGYEIIGSQRYTDNGTEAAQPSNPTTWNYEASEGLYGKMDIQYAPGTSLQGTLNINTGRGDIVPRFGLPNSYGGFGQGYGFAGTQNVGSGLANQYAAGQRNIQRDNNTLAYFQLTRPVNTGSLRIGVGATKSNLGITNRTFNTFNTSNLPSDNSIEFLPTVHNNYDQVSIQADYTVASKTNIHAPKIGFVYQTLDAQESYQYLPQSQIALSALSLLDPRLVPGTGPGTSGISDPVIVAKRSGYYAAGYAQDTFRASPKLTLNYGVRIDSYQQSMVSYVADPLTGRQNQGNSLGSISDAQFSPRLNLAYSVPQTQPGAGGPLGLLKRILSVQPTILRASYNRLFTAPGLGQGTYLQNTSPVRPQVTDQFEGSLERQFNTQMLFRMGLYHKSISHYLQAEQLVPGVEGGMLAVFNQGKVASNGVEVSVELNPIRDGVNPVGSHTFFAYSVTSTAPTSQTSYRNNAGLLIGAYAPAQNNDPRGINQFVEPDQSFTMTAGYSLIKRDGSLFGVTTYYGGGYYAGIPRFYNNVRRLGTRDGVAAVNVRYATGPKLYNKHVGLQFDVENLTDSKSRLGYYAAFGGTRFQEGRRIVVSLNGKF